MDQMHEQAVNVGTRMFEDIIVKTDLNQRPFRAIGDGGDIYTGDTVIIATGASARWLGLESEAKFSGFGVSACATCDGFFFRDKPVAVIGGGNTAVEEALFLTNFASHVYLVHRRDELRAEKILQDRLLRNDKVEPVWDSVLDEVLGVEDPLGVTGIRVRNVKSDAQSEIACEGVFIAIGHTPNSDIFKDQLDMDEHGYLLTQPGTVLTSIDGVFATGDVQDKIYRQAVTAAGTGCMGALEAERFLAEQTDTAEAAE
jgi:thioredoxin reductase (NADPH)